MALGENQTYCTTCNRPVLAVLAGLFNTPHCPSCGKRFTLKDQFNTPQRVSNWQRGQGVTKRAPRASALPPTPTAAPPAPRPSNSTGKPMAKPTRSYTVTSPCNHGYAKSNRGHDGRCLTCNPS
ncbi:MAG: hypothetical protein ACJ716_11815 [Marmoricola sp.]